MVGRLGGVGKGVRVPLDIFGVGAEIGCVVYFIFEKLCRTINKVLR